MPDPFSEHSLSLDVCSQILRRAGLPDARAVARIPRGEVTAAFDLRIVDGRRLVLKVQVREPRPQALLRERAASLLLTSAARLPVPRVLAIDTGQDIIPYNYSLLTRLAGTEGDIVWPALSRARQLRAARALGCMLARIHGTKLPAGPGATVLPMRRTSAEWTARQRARFERALKEHSARGYLPTWLLSDVKHFWAAHHELLEERGPPCLVHGDYDLGNVMIHPQSGEIAGVFDFGQVDIGQAELDLASVAAGTVGAEPELWGAFCAAYRRSRAVEAGLQRRVELYSLLRHLDAMLAYDGPIRFPYGTQSAPETIARLVSPARPHGPRASGEVLDRPAVATAASVLQDPPTLDGISGRHLAGVLARGLAADVEVTYWHRRRDPSWQAFPGRGGDSLIAYQVAARVGRTPTRDVFVILKVTASTREAMFYLRLAPLLSPNVPKPYHVVIRRARGGHWLFLENVPCMVLGPLWGGREFAKAVEGLAAIHSAFWGRPGGLREHRWLPRLHAKRLMSRFRAELSCLFRVPEREEIPEAVRDLLVDLASRAAGRSAAAAKLVRRLATAPFALVHGDYHLANIGTRDRTPEAAPVVADWASCSYGPPELDLAHLLGIVQTLTRATPSREEMVEDYCARLRAAGVVFSSRDEFHGRLMAATLFDDIHALARLAQDWADEVSWRAGGAIGAADEAALRAERAREALCSGP